MRRATAGLARAAVALTVAIAALAVTGSVAPASAQTAGGTTSTTGNRSTPAGSPPSLGAPESVSRDDAGTSTGGVLHTSERADDGSEVPWLLILVIVVALGIGAVLVVWRRTRTDELGSP